MREFVAKTGGRYTYIEDFIGLQDLTKSLVTMYGECGNFIVSGCETSGVSDSATTISEGYVYINGHIRKFAGGTVDLTNPYYIVESERSESVSYAQNATQQGCVYYECFGTAVEPIDKQYVKLTNTFIPRLRDRFFGHYALLLDPQVTQQTVNKKVVFKGEMECAKSVLSDSSLIIRDSTNISTLNIMKSDGGAMRLLFNKSGNDLSYLSFDTDGQVRFSIGGQDKLIISKNNTAFDTIFANVFMNGSLKIDDNQFDALTVDSLEFNKTGRGDMTPKDFVIYDGKGTAVMKVEGALRLTKSFGSFAEESSEEYGLILKDTVHTYRETAYRKGIAWKDKDGVILGSVGFSSSNNDLLMYNEFGNVTLRGKKITFEGTFEVNGTTLDSQYATKTALTEGLSKKVDAVAGMGLSEQNFTSSYKAQLDSLKTGSLQPGDSGLVSGDQVSTGLSDKLSKSQNLADVNSKEAARSNLNVYSKNETDSNFLKSSLSNFPTLTPDQQPAFLAKIGASASSVAVEMEAISSRLNNVVKGIFTDQKTYDSVMTEGGVNQSVVVSKAAFEVHEKKFASLSPSGSNSGLTIRQSGYVVTIGGTVTMKSNGSTLFTIPSGFGKPATYIGGVICHDIGNIDKNRGIYWYCSAGASTFMVSKEYGADGVSVPFFVTYVAESTYNIN